MRRAKSIYLLVLEKLCRIIHKDSMKYKLERYRMNGAEIGENVRAFSPIVSPEPYLIKVGNDVTIAIGVKFCTHDNSAIKIYEDATDFVGTITIGDDSFIGMNTILMGGVSLPKHCIVGAGSVVTKSFTQEGCIIAGNPAKIIGNINVIREKNKDLRFSFINMTPEQKKNEILQHKERYLSK